MRHCSSTRMTLAKWSTAKTLLAQKTVMRRKSAAAGRPKRLQRKTRWVIAIPTAFVPVAVAKDPDHVEHEHKFDQVAEEKASTCTEQGYIVYKCSCGATARAGNFYRWPLINTKTEHALFCGAKDPNAHEHVFDQVAEEKASTCTEQGYVVYKCSCGATTDRQMKELAPHNYVGGVCTVCGTADPNYVSPPTDIPSSSGDAAVPPVTEEPTPETETAEVPTDTPIE